MSCMLIDKQSYARIGTILGFFTEIEEGGGRVLYKYLMDKEKIADSDDIMQDILELYKINVASVCNRWDENIINDNSDIDFDDLRKYREYTNECCYDSKKMYDLVLKIHYFFESVRYQMYNDKLEAKANKIIFEYENRLLTILEKFSDEKTDINCWGSFNLTIN